MANRVARTAQGVALLALLAWPVAAVADPADLLEQLVASNPATAAQAARATEQAVTQSAAEIAQGLSNLFDDPHPGTPDETSARVVGPGLIRVAWHDTGSSNPADLYAVDGTNDPTVHATRGALIAHHLFAGPTNDPIHFVYVILRNLNPGEHCFRIWQREGDYLSKLPSAWTCATLPARTGLSALIGNPARTSPPPPVPAPQLQRLHREPPPPVPAPQLNPDSRPQD